MKPSQNHKIIADIKKKYFDYLQNPSAATRLGANDYYTLADMAINDPSSDVRFEAQNFIDQMRHTQHTAHKWSSIIKNYGGQQGSRQYAESIFGALKQQAPQVQGQQGHPGLQPYNPRAGIRATTPPPERTAQPYAQTSGERTNVNPAPGYTPGQPLQPTPLPQDQPQPVASPETQRTVNQILSNWSPFDVSLLDWATLDNDERNAVIIGAFKAAGKPKRLALQELVEKAFPDTTIDFSNVSDDNVAKVASSLIAKSGAPGPGYKPNPEAGPSTPTPGKHRNVALGDFPIGGELDRIRRMSSNDLRQLNYASLTPTEQKMVRMRALYGDDNQRAAAQSIIQKYIGPNSTIDYNGPSALDPDKGVADLANIISHTYQGALQEEEQETGQPAPPEKLTDEQAAEIVKKMYAGERPEEYGQQEIIGESEKGAKEREKQEEGKPEKGRKKEQGVGLPSVHRYPGPSFAVPFELAKDNNFPIPDEALVAAPEAFLQGSNRGTYLSNQKILREAERKYLGMDQEQYGRYISAREKEFNKQYKQHQVMTGKELGAKAPARPGAEANWQDRLWNYYGGTIATIPRALAAGLGYRLPEGSGNYTEDMRTLRSIYPPETIAKLQEYSQTYLDRFMQHVGPMEQRDLGALEEELPRLFDEVFAEVPQPQIHAVLPEIEAPAITLGPRKVTGKLPAPEFQARGRAAAPQPAQPATAMGRQLAAGGAPAPRPAQPAGLDPAQPIEPSLAEQIRSELGGMRRQLVEGAERTGQFRRVPTATIEDVAEPDEIIPEEGPAQQGADQRVHIPAAHEADYISWLNTSGTMDQLRLNYNEYAASQGFQNVEPFDQWLQGPMGRDYLAHYYDDYMASQFPTYPEGKEAYMRSRQYDAGHPEVPDIEEQLARNPARFPRPYQVQQLPQVAPYEEQLPQAPLQPLPLPFQETAPTPAPLYPQGLAGTLQAARTQFAQRTIPTIAERFAGVGGLRSGAFRGALTEAGRQFEENLARLADERRVQEEQLELGRAAQEARRVEEQNRGYAQREELGSRYGIEYGRLAQQRAQLAREQQLAREREVQQRAQQQQQLGLRGTEVGTNLARQAAVTRQGDVGLLGELGMRRGESQAAITERFGNLRQRQAELGLAGQEAQQRAQLQRATLGGQLLEAQNRMGLSQAEVRERLRQRQQGQLLEQYRTMQGLPEGAAAAPTPGTFGGIVSGIGAGLQAAGETARNVAPYFMKAPVGGI